MSGHAKMSPSGAFRWMNCPGSLEAEAHYPQTTSPAAIEGTFAHEIAAECLTTGADAAACIGRTQPLGNGEVSAVDQEFADHVQRYLDVVRGLCGPSHSSRLLRVEERVRLSSDLWGTADAVVRFGASLHIIDLKFGRLPVQVENNPQLMIYGLAALRSLPAFMTQGITEVRMHIVQPRCPSVGHQWVDLTRNELEQWERAVLHPAADAVRSGIATRQAGAWCTYCRAAADCPTLRQSVQAQVPMAFENLDAPGAPGAPGTDAKSAKRAAARAPVEVSDVELARLLGMLPVVEGYVSAIRKEADRRVREGKSLPGWKLVKATKHRAWIDPEAAGDALWMLAGPGAFRLQTPAQVEKMLPAELRPLVQNLSAKPEGGATLVPTTDSRPALCNPADAFNKLDE